MVKLVDILKELNTKNKEVLGQGWEHVVYPSNNPNKVVKVGETRYVKEWLKVFKTRPDLFPIIYKTGTLKDEPDKMYVVMERLDTEQFEVDFDVLSSILADKGVSISDALKRGEYNEKRWNEYYEFIKGHDEEIADFFVKLYNNVIETKHTKKKMMGGVFDFHKRQFGYDKKHNVKMLDF